MSEQIRTIIHTYRLDVSKPEDAKAYAELCAKMEAQGTKCFETLGNGSHYAPSWDGRKLTLDTSFVFDNQWNTEPVAGVSDKGLRVFDWAMDYQQYSKHLKQGHYLDMTPAMVEVRENRVKCGYCGKQYDKRATPAPPVFCRECLGSQYLKPEDLKLTRVESVLHQTFAPLTPEETAELLPIYQAEQAGKGSERSQKAREDYGVRLRKDFEEKTAEITTKYQGMQWLFEHGCPLRLLENCIYYSHKDVFTFGWRDKLQAGSDLDWLLSNLSEFPYEYNIETAHRGKIGGKE